MAGGALRYLLPGLAAAAILLLAFWHGQRNNADTIRLEGKTMGTTWSALLGKPSSAAESAALTALLQQKLDWINKLMSTYDPDSEISRFNDSSSTGWITVSPETAQVVALAQEISRLSGGAFDVTVGPLVDLWGFGPVPRKERLPSENEIAAIRRQIGYGHLQVRQTPPALRKEIPGLRIDLSAIAKGYAVDLLAEILTAHGFKDMVVEIGGEMVVKGRNPDGRPWRIAVEKPAPGQRAAEKIFSLTDTGMATSGNYRNFFVEGGQRYGHTIDPATGRPVRHKLASVTVLAPTCARADALATALMALGDERAQQFCRQEKIAAYLLLHDGEGTRPVMTDSFKALLVKDKS